MPHGAVPLSKETYYSVKRDLLQCQKRPTTVSKETYYNVKRDLGAVPLWLSNIFLVTCIYVQCTCTQARLTL